MIYALVIAIDDYPIAHHRLNGCVNDAQSLVAYLEGNYPCEELDIKTVFDKDATKANVIAAFAHFQAATSDDTCLLYYSGHGSQVIAPQEFRHTDPDGKLETVVCWDSRIDDGRDLMDKELSYLIWEATHQNNPHFVALFDCCHSGTNTRDVRVTSRMAETAKNVPQARDFHGLERYQSSTAAAGRVDLIPPRGRHIQLAAARASETAKELKIGDQTRGAFTYNLIALLEQYNGQITYSQLVNNLRVKVSNFVDRQTPQIDATEAEDKNLYFLGMVPSNSRENFTVNYDKKADKWLVDAGSIHNWPASRAKEIQLSAKIGSEMVPLTVSSVNIFRSVLEDTGQLDKEKSYLAFLDELPVNKVKVHLHQDGDAAGLAAVETAMKDRPSVYYDSIGKASEADYWVKAVDNTLQLTLPGEERPVFRRINGYNSDQAMIFVGDIESVAHWHHVRNIANPRSTLKRDEYEITLLQVDEPGAWENDDNCAASPVNWQDEVVFNYDYNIAEKKWLQPAFRMKIKNTGNRNLYFSAVNILADYGIKNKFLPLEVLEPNAELFLLDRLSDGQTFKTIPLGVDDAFLAHGINEITEYMKVFISTQEISTDQFNQVSLEMDNPTKADTKRAGRSEANHPPQHDWTVEDIVLKTVRPTQEVELAAGTASEVASAVTIEVPDGMTGIAMLNSKTQSARSLAAVGGLPEFPSGWSSHELAEGLSNMPAVNVLEFVETAGTDKVNADNPIKVNLKRQPTEDEFIIPVALDPETGLFYPVGIMDEDGSVHIEDLPAPTTTGERSLTGSIKIFFQKTIGKYLPFVYQHPQLAIGTLVETDPEEQKAANLKVEYNTEFEAVKAAVRGADRIVMYIHGIIGDTTEMPKSYQLVQDATGKALAENYDLMLTFDYENLNTPIEETAQALKDKLITVGLGPDHGKTFHIVAHSMGGLVSRWFIEKLDGHQIVNHLYQLGTPNQGSPYGSLYEMATPLLANAVNAASFIQPYIIPLRVVGKFMDSMFHTLKQMNPDSDFLKQLNDGSDPGIPYSIIAGNTKLIPPAQAEAQATILQKVMARFKSRGHYDALDTLLFKEANDIAVSTESIKEIPGAADRQFPPVVDICACDHISYFGDPAGLNSMTIVMMEE
ncbi:MAG: caspase family protein [Bacteroidota bacterium]